MSTRWSRTTIQVNMWLAIRKPDVLIFPNNFRFLHFNVALELIKIQNIQMILVLIQELWRWKNGTCFGQVFTMH